LTCSSIFLIIRYLHKEGAPAGLFFKPITGKEPGDFDERQFKFRQKDQTVKQAAKHLRPTSRKIITNPHQLGLYILQTFSFGIIFTLSKIQTGMKFMSNQFITS